MSLIRGDCVAVPLADESVDLIVTSPPYFALRSYTDGGEHYDGQIGSEATPAEFLEALWAATRECVRVLKPSGSLWVNLGDKYVARQDGYGQTDGGSWAKVHRHVGDDRDNGEPIDNAERSRSGALIDASGIQRKSLMGMPWRYALGCIDDLDLILRAEVIWSKPNGLPESVTDRVRRSHEQWFHFTKEPRYFSAVDEIREPHAEAQRPGVLTWDDRRGRDDAAARYSDQNGHGGTAGMAQSPLGRLPGSVWTIDSQLWLDGPIAFCPRCGRDLRAGPGLGGKTARATATTGSRATASAGSTGSPTGSGSAPSPTATPSTTPATTTRTAPEGSGARTDSASTPTTSKPSPCGSTSSEATPSQPETPEPPTAPTATSSPPRTPTTEVTVGASAACVCESVWLPGAPESVWSVPTEPLRLPDHLPQHFAAFPSEWPRRIILGWSPPGICVECGEGRRPVVDKAASETHARDAHRTGRATGPQNRGGGRKADEFSTGVTATITGYACACAYQTNVVTGYVPPTRPARILDPFCGTGTTVAVANALGRTGIGIDLSSDYLKLARWRCEDPVLRAKVLRVPPPRKQVDGQLGLAV